MRLVEAHYRVEVATSTRGLDAATTTVKARRGRILETAAREGQDLFIISAQLPVEACLSKRGGGGDCGGLSFADELRRLTSGAASASLSISHWERLQVCASSAHNPTGDPSALAACSRSTRAYYCAA